MPAGSCAVGAASRQARAQLLKLPSRRTVLTRNPAVPCQGAASSSSAVSRSFASSSTPSQEIPQWQKELQPEETPQWKKEWDSNETPQWQEDMETEETTHSHLGPLAVRDAYKYDALRPRPQSAFVALAHRLKLISHKTDAATQQRRLEALIQACTHVSFIELLARTREQYGEDAEVGFGKGVIRNTARGKFKRVVRDEKVYSQWQVDKTSVRDLQIRAKIDAQYMEATTITSNETLSALGNTLLGLIASEYLHLRYPNLPNRVLKAALSSYVGPNTLADVASEMGIAAKGIVRWDRPARRMEDVPANQRPMMARSMANKPAPDKLLSRDVHADVLRSIIAVMFQEQGLSAARTFVQTHLLSRSVALHSLLKFDEPKRTLSHLCRNLNKTHPQSRLIAETGRLSINPVFVVGVYSGEEKLGEGTGSAIRMAEYRAAEDALRRFYLSERPVDEISLPSMTLDGEFGSNSNAELHQQEQPTVWDIDADDDHQPPRLLPVFQASQIGHSEVIFGSKG